MINEGVKVTKTSFFADHLKKNLVLIQKRNLYIFLYF